MVSDFLARGWVRFGQDQRLKEWAGHARRAARLALADPAQAQWYACQRTWFIGVDALKNDTRGRMGGSAPLAGPAIDFITEHIGPLLPLHRAQVSVIWPGYPRPRAGETPAGFAYRQRRDAAHLDGVKAVGPDRQRRVEEPHAFILGLPLNQTSPGAAPLVVWEGSHEIMRHALMQALSGHDPATWEQVDVTEAYIGARREVFATCRRVLLQTQPGESYLLHRLALHGVAPWQEGTEAGPDGRMIAYFRPPMPGGVARWLDL